MDNKKSWNGRDESSAPYGPLNIYLAEVSARPLLSRKEEYDTACLAWDGKDQVAQEKLVETNLRLVVKIALEYLNPRLEILDLIQEGNLGLLQAVTKYDPHRGTRFSAYAVFWIRAHIMQYIRDMWSVVKVGTTLSERKVFSKLGSSLEVLGTETSSEVAASSLGLRESEFLSAKRRFANPDISLDTPLDDEMDGTLLDTLGSDEDIEDVVCRNEERCILSRFVARFKEVLNDREVLVLERRIMAEEPVSLREIGDALSISHERVRQIEHKLIGKLTERVREERRAVGM